MERIKTGIPGFDELVAGGLPKGSNILVSGGPGAGKTIFAMQYIYNGAKELNEPGLFVTLESNVKNITWNMENFNWDIKSLRDKNLMQIHRLKLATFLTPEKMVKQVDEELNVINQLVEEIGATRLVVDSTTAFAVWAHEAGMLRSLLFRFADSLKDLNVTSIFTAETRGPKTRFSAFGVEEFVADGVVALYFVPPNRSIFVRKMRGTNHSKTVHPFDITNTGIDVRARDELLWEAIK